MRPRWYHGRQSLQHGSLRVKLMGALGRVELPTNGLGNDPSYVSTTT